MRGEVICAPPCVFPIYRQIYRQYAGWCTNDFTAHAYLRVELDRCRELAFFEALIAYYAMKSFSRPLRRFNMIITNDIYRAVWECLKRLRLIALRLESLGLALIHPWRAGCKYGAQYRPQYRTIININCAELLRRAAAREFAHHRSWDILL